MQAEKKVLENALIKLRKNHEIFRNAHGIIELAVSHFLKGEQNTVEVIQLLEKAQIIVKDASYDAEAYLEFAKEKIKEHLETEEIQSKHKQMLEGNQKKQQIMEADDEEKESEVIARNGKEKEKQIQKVPKSTGSKKKKKSKKGNNEKEPEDCGFKKYFDEIVKIEELYNSEVPLLFKQKDSYLKRMKNNVKLIPQLSTRDLLNVRKLYEKMRSQRKLAHLLAISQRSVLNMLRMDLNKLGTEELEQQKLQEEDHQEESDIIQELENKIKIEEDQIELNQESEEEEEEEEVIENENNIDALINDQISNEKQVFSLQNLNQLKENEQQLFQLQQQLQQLESQEARQQKEDHQINSNEGYLKESNGIKKKKINQIIKKKEVEEEQ